MVRSHPPHRRALPRGRKFAAATAATAATAAVAFTMSEAALAVPTVADSFSDYLPGDARADYRTPSAALGQINGDTGFGAVNPFNPPFSSNDVVIIGQGGSLKLHLSQTLPTNGRNLGVYVNNGYVDATEDGSGVSDAGPSTFATPQYPQAVVSVSQDGATWAALNGGNLISFPIATNAYTDSSLAGFFQPIGAAKTAQSKPYLGGIAPLQNATYGQIKTAFNGSAGGNWLDLSSSGLPSVNYVKFDVPNGAGRMVVDAVGGLGAARPLTDQAAIISEEVGTGSNTSHIVVDFGPQSYDYVVHYDGSINGAQALQLLDDNSDFRLTVQHFGFGDFVTGLDYGGFVDVGDGSAGSNWWKYYTGNGSAWTGSGSGPSARTLSNGSYDGWVWQAGQTTPPNFATVPEPASVGLLTFGAMLGVVGRRRRR